MINKGEQEAINILKVLKLTFKNSESYRYTYTLADRNEYTGKFIENILDLILNLIKKQEKRIKELEEINKEHQKLIGELESKLTKNENKED